MLWQCSTKLTMFQVCLLWVEISAQAVTMDDESNVATEPLTLETS